MNHKQGVAVGVVVLVLLAGCGEDGGPAAPQAATSETVVPDTASPEPSIDERIAALQAEIERIRTECDRIATKCEPKPGTPRTQVEARFGVGYPWNL